MISGRFSGGLPQELIDIIIDIVASDEDAKGTLLSCSLTTKAWLPQSSRRLLSDNINLDGITELTGFAATVEHSDRLRQHVRSISIDVSDDDEPHPETMHLLADVVSSLQNLEELAVMGGILSEASHPNVPAARTWPAVKRPIKTLCIFEANIAFVDALLGLFSAVDVLELEGWAGQRDAHQARHADRHAVRELVLLPTRFTKTSSFTAFAALLPAGGVSSLVVDFASLSGYGSTVSLEAVDDVICTAGQNIERFEFRRFQGVYAASNLRLPALATCTALHTIVLSIKIAHLRVRSYYYNPWAEATTVLAHAPPQITRVALDVLLEAPYPEDDVAACLSSQISWPRLEAALAHCAALQVVKVELRDADGVMTQACPRTDARWRETVWEAIRGTVSPRFGALLVFDLRYPDV